MTLVNEVSYLVGVRIDYWAVMDLGGFARTIEDVGGIDVFNSTAIADPGYDWLDGTTPAGFYLAAGKQHLNGKQALAYARSRHGPSNSDYKRAGRQQQVILALLHKMSSPSQLLKLPRLISDVGSNVETTFPANRVADYAAAAANVPSSNFTQIVLGPPYTVGGITKSKASICLLMPKVASESITLFGEDSTWYGKPEPTNTCP
jgi:LCP family protein required for cell wall assembly